MTRDQFVTVAMLTEGLRSPNEIADSSWQADVQLSSYWLGESICNQYVNLARDDLDLAEQLTAYLMGHSDPGVRQFGILAISTVVEVSDARGRDIAPWLDMVRREDQRHNEVAYDGCATDLDYLALSPANRRLVDELLDDLGWL